MSATGRFALMPVTRIDPPHPERMPRAYRSGRSQTVIGGMCGPFCPLPAAAVGTWPTALRMPQPPHSATDGLSPATSAALAAGDARHALPVARNPQQRNGRDGAVARCLAVVQGELGH